MFSTRQLRLCLLALAWPALVVSPACTEAKSHEASAPETKAPAMDTTSAVGATPTPVPGSGTPAEPAPSAKVAPALSATAIPTEERQLFELVMRLINEPASLQELAPNATVVIHGDKKDVKRPFRDAKEELGWIVEQDVQLITATTSADEMKSSTTMRCDGQKLTCTISEGGGQTDLQFARQGADKHIVLTRVEGS